LLEDFCYLLAILNIDEYHINIKITLLGFQDLEKLVGRQLYELTILTFDAQIVFWVINA
jgi:hypothetical protein